MKNLMKVGDGKFTFIHNYEKIKKEYLVTIKDNDTRTIKIFDSKLKPVPMMGDKEIIHLWDDVESTMYDYVDSLELIN